MQLLSNLQLACHHKRADHVREKRL
jgi:hypothetical protein